MPWSPSLADHNEVELELEALGSEEKRLMALLMDRGAGPQGVGPGVMSAMMNLKGGSKTEN